MGLLDLDLTIFLTENAHRVPQNRHKKEKHKIEHTEEVENGKKEKKIGLSEDIQNTYHKKRMIRFTI